MDDFLGFVVERWYVVLAATVVLAIAFKVLKAILKWVVLLVLAAGLAYYVLQYRDEHHKKPRASSVLVDVQSHALDALRKELRNGRFERRDDGTYRLRTKNVVLEGRTGDKRARVTYKKHSFDIDLDENWERLIETARNTL